MSEILIGKIKQTIDEAKKYHIYTSESIEIIKNGKLIGAADSYQEACQVINEYLDTINFKGDGYWRFLMNDTATFIDYGSWSKFIAIIPPIPMKEMMGEED